MMNKQQLLRDPDIEPTGEVIAEALGSASAAYIKFIKGMKSYDIEVDWRYYNDGKAWLGKGLYTLIGARGGQKEVTAFWLSIWDSFFKVTIYIPEKARLDALTLPIADDIKNVIADAKQIGKLKIIPVQFDLFSGALFDDVYTLINFRKMLK